jgi:CUE domain
MTATRSSEAAVLGQLKQIFPGHSSSLLRNAATQHNFDLELTIANLLAADTHEQKPLQVCSYVDKNRCAAPAGKHWTVSDVRIVAVGATIAAASRLAPKEQAKSSVGRLALTHQAAAARERTWRRRVLPAAALSTACKAAAGQQRGVSQSGW